MESEVGCPAGYVIMPPQNIQDKKGRKHTMSLTPIRNHLIQARAEKYAIPLFDAFEMQGAAGIFAAIAEKQAPAIVALYAPRLAEPDAVGFAAYLRTMAEQSPTPVSLMLDHGGSYAQCAQAVAWGFTDVMFDGSQLPLADNIAQTKAVVQMAHAQGVGVEAELGHVGDAAHPDNPQAHFTDPDIVPDFIAATGVDSLAIAFGTAHGVSKNYQPQLNLDLVRQIAALVEMPLVMHGGSGLSDDQFRAAIQSGISKVNVSTNLVQAAQSGLRTAAAQAESDFFAIMDAAQKGYRENCGRILDLFGASGKAKAS